MGYVALVIDSLGSRGIDKRPKSPYPHWQYADAFGALAFLQTQPFADSARIGVGGWSHGGWTGLHAARVNASTSQRFARRVGNFRAVVALYPYCGVTDVFDIPILILIGERDDWTPASMCTTMARAAQQMGSPEKVEVVLYPNATHGFDSEPLADADQVAAWVKDDPNVEAAPNGIRYFGHLMIYDAEVAADAIARVEAFLAEHLGRRSGD